MVYTYVPFSWGGIGLSLAMLALMMPVFVWIMRRIDDDPFALESMVMASFLLGIIGFALLAYDLPATYANARAICLIVSIVYFLGTLFYLGIGQPIARFAYRVARILMTPGGPPEI